MLRRIALVYETANADTRPARHVLVDGHIAVPDDAGDDELDRIHLEQLEQLANILELSRRDLLEKMRRRHNAWRGLGG